MLVPPAGFESLCDRIISGEASDFEVARFRETLRRSPELMDAYIEQMRVHSELEWLDAAGGASGWMQGRGKRLSRQPRLWLLAAASGLALLSGVVVRVGLLTRAIDGSLFSGQFESVPAVRVIRQAEGTEELTVPPALPGKLRLASGWAAFRLASGVEVNVLGPVEVEVLDAMRVHLVSGRLLANVPHWATGFKVTTPELEMWDLGTVFGVTVATNGVSDVFVFQGSVQVNEASGEPVDLCVAGEGVHAIAGRMPVKVAADWPEAQQLLAIVRGPAALSNPMAAFITADTITGMWLKRWLPRVVSASSTIKAETPPPSTKKGSAGMRYPKKTWASLAVGAAALGSALTASAQESINDPVAYWNFADAGQALSNLVTSSPYFDASVLFGQPTAGLADGAAGIAGDALVLDGASALRLPYHQDNLGRSFTIALWYWQQTNDTRQCLFQSRDNYTVSYESNYTLWYEGNFTLDSFVSHVGQEWAGSFKTGLKTWVHVAHTFATDGNTTTLIVYSNGVPRLTKEVNADTMFEQYGVRGLHVGAYRSATGPADGRCFKGMVDELALWNRALSAAEVQAVYARGAGGQALAFTPKAPPSITLAPGQLARSVRMDAGIPDGMFNNGWLRSAGAGFPGCVLETAGAAEEAVGSVMPDTAGHADGPFNAVKLAPMRWRAQMAAGSALKRLPQGDFTVESWFRTTSTAPNILFGTFPGTGGGVVNLQLENNSQAMLYWRKNEATTAERIQVTPSENLRGRDGNWHHLAGVRSTTNAYLYMDGVLIGSNTWTHGAFDLGGDTLYIGQDGRGNFGLFNGEIGTGRVWARALSGAEVAGLAANSMPGAGVVARDGLLAEYAPYNPFNAVADQNGWRIPLSPQLRQLPQTNFTCEVKFRTTDTGRGILMGDYAVSDVPSGFSVELYTNTVVKFLLWKDGTWVYCEKSTGAVNMRDGEWHRLAAVRRNGKACLYLDGQPLGAEVTDTLGAYTLPGSYLGIGKDFRSPSLPLNGDLSAARIWNRALTAEEIAGLSASNAVPTAGLVAQYVPFPTNTLRTAGFPGSLFLRSMSKGANSASLVFTGLPRHTKIDLGLLLAQLDSLDPSAENDRFTIRIDGADVLRVGLGPAQGSEPQVHSLFLFGAAADAQPFKNTLTLGGQDLFGGGGDIFYNDHVYDLSQLKALQNIPHTRDTLVLDFDAVQSSAGENEGFGVDDICLTVYPPQGTLISVW